MRRVLVCVLAAAATADAFSAPLSVGFGGRGAAAVARRAPQPAVRPGRVALRSGIKVEGKGVSCSARPRPSAVAALCCVSLAILAPRVHSCTMALMDDGAHGRGAVQSRVRRNAMDRPSPVQWVTSTCRPRR